MAALTYGNFQTFSGGSGTLSVGSTLFVDAVNGNDATGKVGSLSSPYLTVSAAVAAASSGQVVVVGPGTFSMGTAQLKPANGVSISGAGAALTTLSFTNTSTAGFVCFNPGNGQFRDFTIVATAGANSGSTFVIPIGFNTANGDQVATGCTFNNVNTVAWSDGVNFQFGTTTAAGPLNWTFNNCNFASNSDCIESATTGTHAWNMNCVFNNCTAIATYDGVTANNLETVGIQENDAGTGLYRFVGGYYGLVNGPTGTNRCIHLAAAADTVELDGPAIYVSGTGTNQSIRNHGGTMRIGQGTTFTPIGNQFNAGTTTFTTSGGLINLPTAVSVMLYVDGTYGSDTLGNGSLAAPYATIGKAATSAQTSGQIIKVMAGAYSFSTTITLHAGVSLIGSGRTNTVLTFTPTSGTAITLPTSGTTELADFTLLTSQAENLGATPISAASTAPNLICRNLSVTGNQDCIAYAAATGSTITAYLYHCIFNTNWDNLNFGVNAASAIYAFDCQFIAVYNVGQTNDIRCVDCNTCPHYLYGCSISVTGGANTGKDYGVHCEGAGTCELHGCTIVGTGTNFIAMKAETGTSIKVGPDCLYTPNNITFAGTGTIAGLAPQILGTNGTTVAPGTGAGTGGTTTLTTGSDDSHGQITIATGGSPAATATICTLTFGSAKLNSFPTITPANATSQALSGATAVAIGTSSGSSFTIKSGATNLSASNTYTLNYSA